MSVESKLDQILINQAAILTAIAAVSPAANEAVLTQIETQVASIQTTLGTEVPPSTPEPTMAPVG